LRVTGKSECTGEDRDVVIACLGNEVCVERVESRVGEASNVDEKRPPAGIQIAGLGRLDYRLDVETIGVRNK